jgi:hypothetical protein
METNAPDKQPKPQIDQDKKTEKGNLNSSGISDPVNTTVGVIDLIKEFFKAIFSK